LKISHLASIDFDVDVVVVVDLEVDANVEGDVTH
jgi:hypothetical protein